MTGRKELKFLCDERLLIQIENRIKGIMKKDAHQNGDSYNVRSIYFDSPYDSCLSDNESGVGTRSKYRIRIYDCSDAVIKAEVKNKYYDTTLKESSNITRDQFLACINSGSIMSMTGNAGNSEAIMKLASKITAEAYRPAAIVEYERTAYTYPLCNVRVTFDRNIVAGKDYGLFFDKDMPARPVCEQGLHVLEIKYDEFLPDYLRTLLCAADMRRTSFSKYYMGRMALRDY